MSQEINTALTTVVLVSGYNLLAAGCIGPFVSAFSRKYGKRPVFLVSTLFDIIGTAVGESKISYKYLLAARIIQGFSTSAFESLIVATVGDMYFVHQRGLRIAIINFVLNSASSLASIICGQVFAHLGWLWLFHMFQIFLVVQFVLMFLFCPETTYIRDARYETDVTREEKLQELAKLEHEHEVEIVEAEKQHHAPIVPAKKTFVQELAVWTGVYSRDNILKFLAGPFLTLLNPAACYAVIASGLLNSWYATVQYMLCRTSFDNFQVRRLRHYPRWYLQRSSVEFRSCADRLHWSWAFHRGHDRKHFRGTHWRSRHQMDDKNEQRRLRAGISPCLHVPGSHCVRIGNVPIRVHYGHWVTSAIVCVSARSHECRSSDWNILDIELWSRFVPEAEQ